MPKKTFKAGQIVLLRRSIEVVMSRGKAALAEKPAYRSRAPRRAPEWRNFL
jgi:hypothetical protein